MRAPSRVGGGRDRQIALVWAGMVLGVSFLATPAKFLAPSLTLPVAMEVGRKTFRVFGWVETAMSALLGLQVAAARPVRLLALAPIGLVALQALRLRPRLERRTQKVLENTAAPRSSSPHRAMVAAEVAKLAALLALGLPWPGSRP